MGFHPQFPADPYQIIHPDVRWYPGEELLGRIGLANLLPPLVHRIREGVWKWRDSDYAGASGTTKALLRHWFETEHLLPQPDGTVGKFRYYFSQREAVESAIWLYEIEEARDPYGLIKYDTAGQVTKSMFREDWTRYVMKLATGAGKTKVMSLLIAWSYFHKIYEEGSELSKNFLLIAPNIIVLDRLATDFDGLKIFFNDPVLPDNGYDGRNWRDDFQITLHKQDHVSNVSPTGNIFLTNIHRVYEKEEAPKTFEEAKDKLDFFAGPRPTGKTTDSRVDLGDIIRNVSELVVINDEAHHVHEEDLAWFKSIGDISNRLKLKGGKLSAQFDLTATPKHTNGAIFVQTISDYPLVEAVRQGVVKTPVLPDPASRAKLQERKSSKFSERYRDYLQLGYLEWEKVYDELEPAGKKSILFVMTDDTKNCDEVAEYLENTYQKLEGKVLVIHTKNNGEISESATGKNKDELDRLRKLSREIDSWDNPYKAIVSVMVLREGWDVQNVVSIVGLRPFKAASKILPEQTIGRGLRRMFRGQNVQEKVSVIGTDAFIDFVESIKDEGVELEYSAMGDRTKPQSPTVIEVDSENRKKDLDELDIDIPVLTPRIYREYKNLAEIDVSGLPTPKLQVKQFTEQQQREIVFLEIDTGAESHKTQMDGDFVPNHQNMIAFFARRLMRELHLVGGFDGLFGLMKDYVQNRLFGQSVDLDDLNVLRNLSEIEATRTIHETFRKAINDLTIQDTGTTKIQEYIKVSKTRPYLSDKKEYFRPDKSIFNKVVGDSPLELDFAHFLDKCPDIVSFFKNSNATHFKIEYNKAGGGIADYYPDFVVNQDGKNYWIIETKGREDLDDPQKWERLKQWCEDATAHDPKKHYRALFVRQEEWEKYHPATFKELVKAVG